MTTDRRGEIWTNGNWYWIIVTPPKRKGGNYGCLVWGPVRELYVNNGFRWREDVNPDIFGELQPVVQRHLGALPDYTDEPREEHA